MIRDYPLEKWEHVVFDDKIAEFENYKISNYGRLINCKKDQERLVDPSLTNGYVSISLKQRVNGKSTGRYIHKLVAQHFLVKEDNQIYVIHLDYDKINNRVENLKWATKREKEVHQYSGENYKNRKIDRSYAKLTESRVRLIRRKVNDPNRRTRIKMIAKEFGISEMQLYRVVSGENWKHITDY
ncbi:HNH endonuclease [Algibacter sp. L4_22]|uniref:HNH endonuclease n=1 Tax=Algibacter sp. L4_22 TaxID=2942477 RepID=UPI00201B8B57|nr:HNH endonuclease [Algibacter sp. L4_22]MCL5128213.1 HNH endonuclease [Algibacter sp. L4_22]